MRSLKQVICEFLNKILQQSKIQVFFVGVMIGLIASWLYLLAGGEAVIFVPVWAEIVFYPGFHVGWYCYDLFGSNISLAYLFGSLSVGLFYGIAFVVVLSIWSLLARMARMGKYATALLCLITIIVGMLFLGHLFFHPLSKRAFDLLKQELEQEFTLSITSDPSGAKVYPLSGLHHRRPPFTGSTPLELKGSYHIDKDGSGWGVSGCGITLDSTEEGFLIRLDCVVVKNGYMCQELAPVLGTILKKNGLPDQMPSELKYNAKLIPNESPHISKVGTAVIVNGSFLEVNPPTLKLTEGVYIIDIKSAE